MDSHFALLVAILPDTLGSGTISLCEYTITVELSIPELACELSAVRVHEDAVALRLIIAPLASVRPSAGPSESTFALLLTHN